MLEGERGAHVRQRNGTSRGGVAAGGGMERVAVRGPAGRRLREGRQGEGEGGGRRTGNRGCSSF